MKNIGLLLFFSSFVVGCFAVRPELVDKKMWFVNDTILNVDYEMAVLEMEFDQDLYLSGETFLCGRAEQDCPVTSCTPCDWSSQQPSGCDNVNCCGPAQVGGSALDQVNDWCEPSSTPYHSLTLNEKSPIFTVEPRETSYFRFFIPEEAHCKPFQIFIRPFYGAPTFSLSNLYAFPTTETAQWRKGRVPPNSGWAQNSFAVCPNAHADYQLGTYSLAVFSWYSSSFYVEVVVSPQDYPLVPPPDRILCADVPASELTDAQAGSSEPVFCLQDTESLQLDYDESHAGDRNQFVLPLTPGCHQVSFAVTGTEPGTDTDINCLPKDITSTVLGANSMITRITTGDDRFTFSVCSEDVSYLRCAAQFWVPGPSSLIFSTVSIPYRVPLAPTTTTPSAGITYQEGITAVSSGIFGIGSSPCSDFNSVCKEWIVPPISDPLIFWPPPPQIPKIDTENTNVYQDYFDATNAQPLDNTLIIVLTLKAGTQVIYERSELDKVAMAIMYVTNEFGEPPLLPNNAIDLNEKTQASPSQYLSTISLSSFPVVNLAELCDQTSYDTLQNVVNSQLTEILESDSPQTIEFHKYVLDILNAGIAGTSCTQAAIEAMNVRLENVTLVDYDICPPTEIEREEEQFTTADVSTCGVPECAETYFEDLAQALNNVDNLAQGCSSGVQDIQFELASVVEKQLERVVRDCLNQVGLGDDFMGIDCSADFECAQWSGRCNHQTKKCVIGTLSEVEDAYLQCYISKMTSSLEDYLRLNVLPPEAASAPTDSELFFLGLKSAALVDDCITANDPLDISLRSQYVWTASVTCKAGILGLPADDVEGVNALCPPGYCLGTSCRQSTAQCYRSCEPLYIYHPSSEAECDLSSTVCPVTELPAGTCDGNYCVYCPGENEEDCQYVPGNQDFCENTVACELEDGSVVFGLTESECDAQTGYCSVDCPGESCRSLDGLDGTCLATVSSESLCDDINSIIGVDAIWYEDTICVISAQSESTCAQLSSTISAPTTWETCESLSTTECDGSDPYQRYLKCYVDLWHTCTSREECEGSGQCTDQSWTTIVRSAEHPIDVQFGACFISGFIVQAGLGGIFCFISTDRPGIGCRQHAVLAPDACSGASFYQYAWLTPAMSEAECVNKNQGRYGCQMPETESSLVWYDDDECECQGGIPMYRWDWTDGVWSNGVSRTLQWREIIQPVQKYEWSPSLSFELLQTWLEKNEEQRFSFAVKSEVICENGYVSSSLNTLVCDCFGSNETTQGHNSQCYDQTGDQVEELVGLSGACFQEQSFLKGPSSRLSFGMDSISSGCSLANLSIVSEAWFAVPPPRPSVSFQFEKKPQRGIVLNKKGATVGVLRGDGSVFSFSTLENVVSFSVCLLISDNQTDTTSYPIQDFGYSNKPIGTIFPLGLTDINSTIVIGSLFWCGTIVVDDVPLDGNNIRLFPIQRTENYETEEEDYTSRKTRALMYTLGVCYCICFVLLSFYLINCIRNPTKGQMLMIISALFVILCVFRAVFMFGYPNGIFEGNELAEFVVFEIPTFLLFSVVIASIFFWKRLASRSKFFGGDSAKLRGAIVLGLLLVWSLWVVVTIIYSEVILEENTESPCPGRVAPSYEQQEKDTRTLTIIYQSLIISVTFVLAAIFCFYSYSLISLSKRVSRSKRFVMVIGGTIVLSFFVRCVLFIIILAVEFVSSVYMFLTLMITEVLLLFFLQLQFNSSNFRSLLGGSSTGSTLNDTVGRTTGHVTSKGGSLMDD